MIARLSEQAAQWIVGVLATATKERKLRSAEHRCLDRLVDEKVISR